MQSLLREEDVNTVKQVLVLLLDQQQWDRAYTVASWLADRGDMAAGVVRVEVMVAMKRYNEALEALCLLPIPLRKISRVRKLESRALYALGNTEFARKIYKSTLQNSLR